MLKTVKTNLNLIKNVLIKFNLILTEPCDILITKNIKFKYLGNYVFKINDIQYSLDEINSNPYFTSYLIEIFSDYITSTYISINGFTKKINIPLPKIDLRFNPNIQNYTITNNIDNPIEHDLLITEDSPRLLLFSAHNIRNTIDEITSCYDVPVERLNTLFNYLQTRNYTPVSWEQILNWKINNAKLPKHSYAIMIDDFPVDNYIDKNKRDVFDRYNVKPGLAIVLPSSINSTKIAIDGVDIPLTFNYNNRSYSRLEILNEIQNYGWCLACHLDHRKIEYDDPRTMLSKFNNDIEIAKKYNLNTNIIVYPYGSINLSALKILPQTDFKLGIYISSNKYNCKASNNYFLTRISLNNNIPIETILNKI